MKFTITLTDAEAKAMSIISSDPKEWATNAIKERARFAMEDIFQNEVQRMIADPTITDIPADREAVVMAYEPVVIDPVSIMEPVIETVVDTPVEVAVEPVIETVVETPVVVEEIPTPTE